MRSISAASERTPASTSLGGDRLDRPVLERFDERLPVLLGPKRRVHLHVRVEGAHGLVSQAQVVRRDLPARFDAGRAGAPELVHGLAGGEVEQVDWLILVGGQHEVAPDHHAFGHRGIAREA